MLIFGFIGNGSFIEGENVVLSRDSKSKPPQQICANLNGRIWITIADNDKLHTGNWSKSLPRDTLS